MKQTENLKDVIKDLQAFEKFLNSSRRKCELNNRKEKFFESNEEILKKTSIAFLCSYVESYLKKSFEEIFNMLNIKLNNIPVPKNLISYMYKDGVSKQELTDNLENNFSLFKTDIKTEVEKMSANIDITIKFFLLIGINLENEKEFNVFKTVISSLVDKRNKIMHHGYIPNETFGDILDLKKQVTDYLKFLDKHLVSTGYLD